METMFAVMNTDRINRQGTRFPGRVLAQSIETLVAACLRRGLPIGTPSHNAHDVHRPIGWSVGTELYLTADMTRQIGDILMVETHAERAQLQDLCDRYWEAYHMESVAPYRSELEAQLQGVDLCGAQFVRAEAASVIRSGLAAEIYPQYFTINAGAVDKDGLVDMTAFLGAVTELDSGVFHDRERDLLLFAHPSFRRSLSRRNQLNAYFLDIFRETATNPGLGPRLRLDPDMVGLPASALRTIELEYWRGPRFDQDIAAIPDGVTEHKAEGHQRDLEGIDKTQIWWKQPETRTNADGQSTTYRTFECEELIENPSAGLGEDVFGCRYAHAEYDAGRGVISHFDGAIRAYEGDAYLARIDASIDRAGKQAQYTKLFRFDGTLPVDAWKRLLTGYYRGNALIPEYFGDEPEEAGYAPPLPNSQSKSDEVVGATPAAAASALSALVSFHLPRHDSGVGIISQDDIQLGSATHGVVELGDGAVSTFLNGRCNLTGVITFAPTDDVLNLSPLTIGRDAFDDWQLIVSDLARALEADAKSGRVASVSCSLIWDNAACGVRLSVAGEALRVAALLHDVAQAVHPAAEAATWFEVLEAGLKRAAPEESIEPAWGRIRPRAGRLQAPRAGVHEVAFMIPEGLLDPELAEALCKAAPPSAT